MPFPFSLQLTATIGPVGTASIVIDNRGGLSFAPEAMVFSATVSGFESTGPTGGDVYDDRLHEIEYYWDFYYGGTDNSYSYVAPTNLDASKKQSRYKKGPVTSHTYRTAGTYTVQLTCYEPASGITAVATLEVVVANPDDVFATTDTVFMSPSGDFTDAPSGATEVTSGDLDAVLVSDVLGVDTTPKRLILNRGESYTCSGISLGYGAANDVPHLLITAGSGAGANPVVTSTGPINWDDTETSDSGVGKQLTIQNIDFTGNWDSTTNTGTAVDCISFVGNDSPYVSRNSPHQFLLDGCTIDGFDHCVYGGADNNVINDSVFTNWAYWGTQVGGDIYAETGSSFRSHVDAYVTTTKNGGASIRCTSSTQLIHSSDNFCRQAWSEGGTGTYVQPSARLNANVDADLVVVTDSVLEGGVKILTAIKSEPGQTPAACNTLIDGNYFLGGYRTTQMIELSTGGATIRNNIMVWPSSTPIAGGGAYGFMTFSLDGGDAGNAAEPISMYNNTCVYGRTDAQDSGTPSIYTNSGFTGTITSADYVYHAPNRDTPVTTDAPLADDTNTFTPREKGFWNAVTLLSANPDSPTPTTAGTTDTFDPETGSAAIADATGWLASKDYFGATRANPSSRGASEVV